MPIVKIEIRKGRPPEEKRAIHEAVHEALVEAIRIPEHDRTQRIVEYVAEDFEIPPNKSDRFTLITITMFPGRSDAAKAALYRALVKKLGALGVPADDVFVVLQETDLINWGIRGGVPASEVELGFELKV
jgi:phenylpyruvate tautomerase PptA (4-oxalocrotonate tautomerase family)